MKQNAKKILELLDHYFPEPQIPLKHDDPYTLLVAVLLSAQCTDKRVNEVTPELFKLANTPEKMAMAPLEKIEEIIQPCGLFKNKSLFIKKLCQMLIDEFGSTVPNDLKSLEKLPGVGHKTASVVLCQAFNKPAFPVDTHIHRCAKRWGLSSGKNVVQTERDLKKAFPKNRWIKLHLQIIYYARTYCPARGHLVESCPICKSLQNAM